MSPDELRRLMRRFRLSSEKLGKAIGVHPVTVRRWRSGARHPGRDDVHRMMAFFRDLGRGEPTATIDPAEIVPMPIEHRITIEARDDPPTLANGATIVEAINELVVGLVPRRRVDPMLAPAPIKTEVAAPTARPPQPMALFRRDDRRLPAHPITRPPAAQPQIIDAMPLGPPPEPFSAPRGARCHWPHTDAPGAPSGPCEQMAAPGLPYCAPHWVQHLQHRQRFG
jgi:hypothetical protein